MPLTHTSAPGWAVQSRNAVHWLAQAAPAMLCAVTQLCSQAASGWAFPHGSW
jgi:hypothetical protein